MVLDQKKFRNVLGRFATGVCVVSAINSDGSPIGMTINSFTSVSLNPSLILWSIKRESLCYSLFVDVSAYSVSVLSDVQIAVSNRYAKAGDHIMVEGDYEMSDRRLPYVRNSIAHFECEKWQSYEAGDHEIIVANVVEFFNNAEMEPLIFYSGSYRGLQLSA